MIRFHSDLDKLTWLPAGMITTELAAVLGYIILRTTGANGPIWRTTLGDPGYNQQSSHSESELPDETLGHATLRARMFGWVSIYSRFLLSMILFPGYHIMVW